MKSKQQSPNRSLLGLALMAALAILLSGYFQIGMAQSNTFPSTGNAGIGTTTPANPLHVTTGAAVSEIVRVESTTNSTNVVIGLKDGSPGQTRTFAFNFLNTSGLAIGQIGYANNTTGASQYMNFNTNGTERMRIDGSGNVGIGTTSIPTFYHTTTALQLGGNANFQFITARGSGGTSDWFQNGYVDEATSNFKYISSDFMSYIQQYNGTINFANAPSGTADSIATPTSRMLIGNTGNVGIGTTSPTQQLHVFSAGAYSRILSEDTSATGYAEVSVKGSAREYILGVGGGSEAAVGVPNKFFVYDNTGGAMRMVIDPSGYVGIGTATPGYKLDVNGTVNATGLNINGSPVTGSVFGRTGAVVAATNDYTWAQIDKTTSSLANLTTRSAGDLSSGTLPDARFPATLPAVSGANLTSLNASSLASGTVAAARLGSGTADATTFLRGDNTWAVPAGATQWTTSGSNINYATSGGNVGVGQTNPTYKLDVNGTAHVSGNMTVDGNLAAKYQDMAEWVPSSEQLPTGTVVVLDSTKSNHVIASTVTYDTRVAGVISAQPGIALGEGGANKVLVATTGRVRVKVDATRAPIQVGDLLVASDVPGMAMKSEPVNIGGVQLHRPGTLIGKALEPLAKGQSEILVLLSLQ